jgi:hypothetical protein
MCSGLTEKELKLKQLSRWVGNQRVYYNNYILGKPSNQLKPARIAALNDLGFICDLKSATWNMMYQELCERKEEYNTTRVSNRSMLNCTSGQLYTKSNGRNYMKENHRK